MIEILVCGDNHFIVSGPVPDRAAARTLARHWTIINIGQTKTPSLQRWTVVTRPFMQDLAWVIVVPGDGKITSDVVQSLQELAARGVAIFRV
jgi:hypothetical protein